MKKVNIVDGTFAHSILGYCSDHQVTEKFQWDRTLTSMDFSEIVYTDMYLGDVKPENKDVSIAWIIEPLEWSPQYYNTIKQLYKNYHKVLTHEKTLLDIGDPYEFVPFGCCWIPKNDQNIYKKNKNLSIIASSKTIMKGHKLRHAAIEIFGDDMDVYGRGWNEIEAKLEGLKDYRFSVAIENCKRDYWFTEKLIDCFMTGTIPIYWGCPSIGDFFDTRGMLIFDNMDQFSKLLSELTEERYNEMLPYIHNNFDAAKKYLLPDEWVFSKITK